MLFVLLVVLTILFVIFVVRQLLLQRRITARQRAAQQQLAHTAGVDDRRPIQGSDDDA